jgi:hypothetical protein
LKAGIIVSKSYTSNENVTNLQHFSHINLFTYNRVGECLQRRVKIKQLYTSHTIYLKADDFKRTTAVRFRLDSQGKMFIFQTNNEFFVTKFALENDVV